MAEKPRIGGGGAASRTKLLRLASCNSGATSLEYGLIAAVLAVSIITTFTVFGSSIRGMYDQIGTMIASKMTEGW